MLFNSYIFIFLFLPITLIGWYLFNKAKLYKSATLFLSLMSFWFYGYYNYYYLLILIGSILINYFFSYLIKKTSQKGSKVFVKTVMLTGVTANLLVLGIFKYYDFFVTNINKIFCTNFNLRNIILPLGISFFTFQQISFVIDRYRGQCQHYSLVDYVAYVSFFPQLIAGPIVLHSEMIPQLVNYEKRKFDVALFYEGCLYFSLGLAKKVLIADFLGNVVDYFYTYAEYLDTPGAILIVITYAMQLFFDFSGYSDMAIGLGLLFGIRLPINFNSPYKAVSVKDFWRRWHITLGRFFTTYVYIPLGGNKKGVARTIINVMIVFSLSGLWHGSEWSFVIWGILHGIGVALADIFSLIKKKSENKICKKVGQIFTFIYVSLAFVFFRSDNVAQAVTVFKRLFSGTFYHAIRYATWEIKCPEVYLITKILSMKANAYLTYWYLALYLFVLVLALVFSFKMSTKEIIDKYRTKNAFALICALFLVWSVISFSNVSKFLYFNF